jgi:hypothetical protein
MTYGKKVWEMRRRVALKVLETSSREYPLVKVSTNETSSSRARVHNSIAGKLSPTSSHLLKLILSLGNNQPPTVFLLHPSQPLSHVSRLISTSLPDKSVSVSFRTVVGSIAQPGPTAPEKTIQQSHEDYGNEVQWADSTDIGDFTKVSSFYCLFYPPANAYG